MTENHGVPGSIPGLATFKTSAKRKKIGTLLQRAESL
jgi:hypothetical protein